MLWSAVKSIRRGLLCSTKQHRTKKRSKSSLKFFWQFASGFEGSADQRLRSSSFAI